MSDQRTPSVDDIPDLLHDATLRSIEFDAALRIARVTYSCLRRNPDGSELLDRNVELRISSVERIAAYYDAANFKQRFSEFSDLQYFNIDALQQAPIEDFDCEIAVNSLDELFNLRTSGHVDWLVGEPIEIEFPTDVFCLFVTLKTGNYRLGAVRSSIMFQGTSIETWSSGKPLSLQEWGSQFAAWWKGWENHWESDRLDEPKEEDVFIPAGEESPQDLKFRPPDKPAFAVNPEDVNAALLEPIRDYHEGILTRDWSRVAKAWPNLDKDDTEQAREFESSFLGDEFGRWVYLRQLESFWQEGPRACVTLRGVEYWAPFDNEPAETVETVVSYCLRCLDGRWVIRKYSQG